MMNKAIARIGSIIVMMIHGIFFFVCFIMSMTGVFSASMSDGSDGIGGMIA